MTSIAQQTTRANQRLLVGEASVTFAPTPWEASSERSFLPLRPEMLHPHIEVRVSPIAGRGLFVTAPIRKGEVVWRAEPNEPTYSSAEIARFSEEERAYFHNFSYQVGPDRFHGPRLGEQDPANFMNHACDPTCWFIDDETMVATRDLSIDDEVTYDYATSEIDESFRMPCSCGARACRGVVTARDLFQDRALGERYRSHVLTHVAAALAKL